jgi:hypothetical protein
MKVLTFSRQFPTRHPKAGQPTYFVEKVWNGFRENFALPEQFRPWTESYVPLLKGDEYLESMAIRDIKHHTIRSGDRWKPGEMASLRVWSDKPYRSKQIEFAQVEVKRVWDIVVYASEFTFEVKVNDALQDKEGQEQVALNDGLNLIDFYNWFRIHPKKKELLFTGQIICWSPSIDYTPSLTKKA